MVPLIESDERQRGDGPWLTALCDRYLRYLSANDYSARSAPLDDVPGHLLVAKVFGMGDSVLVRSIVEQLRGRHPQMEIGVLAGPPTVELLTLGSNYRVHIYSQKDLSVKTALGLLREIRRCRYDAILNFEQGSLAGTAFLALTGIPLRIGFLAPGLEIKSRFLTHVLRFDDSRSMWESFGDLARLADPGLVTAKSALAIRCRPDTERWVDQWWNSRVAVSALPVAFHLGSAPGMDFRRWPLERFVHLARELDSRRAGVCVLLTGTEVEKDLITQFMRDYSGCAVDASALGSIERTVGVLQRCGLLVSNDTGIMHLGAALGVPTVGLFGPNTPRHWAPIGPRAAYVYDTAEPCSPCINNYTNRMPAACVNPVKSRCMYDISVASVLNAAERVLHP